MELLPGVALRTYVDQMFTQNSSHSQSFFNLRRGRKKKVSDCEYFNPIETQDLGSLQKVQDPNEVDEQGS